jgi:hypothetical protein
MKADISFNIYRFERRCVSVLACGMEFRYSLKPCAELMMGITNDAHDYTVTAVNCQKLLTLEPQMSNLCRLASPMSAPFRTCGNSSSADN